MHIAMSPDQESFALDCRRMLAKECPPSLVREVATPKGSGHSPGLHRVLAQAGWFDMAVAQPGSDDSGTLFDLGIAYREAGRVLVPTTLHSTVLAGLVLRRCLRTAAVEELSARIGSGAGLATVAYVESDASTHEHAARYLTAASPTGDGWLLQGAKAFVLNARTADVLLVAAAIDSADEASVRRRFGLFQVDPRASGVQLRDLATFGHDAQADVTFAGVHVGPDALLAGPLEEEDWIAWFGRPIDEATALLCMEMLGGAERVIEDTVAYVNQRIVFDRPVGSFQSVQHMLADSAIAANASRVAALLAMWAVTNTEDARREVSTAKSWLARAYKDVTLVAHQLHGGAGYVREADLHLWSQRAKAAEPLFGGRVRHLRRLASLGARSGR